MSFIEELKQFAVKGNAVDMAIGILVGGAFTKVVNPSACSSAELISNLCSIRS